MAWFAGQSLIALVLMFLLGLLVGWLVWARKQDAAAQEPSADGGLQARLDSATEDLDRVRAELEDCRATSAAASEKRLATAAHYAEVGSAIAAGSRAAGGTAPDPDAPPARDLTTSLAEALAATEPSTFEPTVPAAPGVPAVRLANRTSAPAGVSEPTPPATLFGNPDELGALDEDAEDNGTVRADDDTARGDDDTARADVGVGAGSDPKVAAGPADRTQRAAGASLAVEGAVEPADEAALAAEAAPAPAAPVAPDRIERIEGIGPKIGAALRAAELGSFAAIADAAEDDLRAALQAGGLRFAPSLVTWSRQARLLADGDETGFAALTDGLVAGREA